MHLGSSHDLSVQSCAAAIGAACLRAKRESLAPQECTQELKASLVQAADAGPHLCTIAAAAVAAIAWPLSPAACWHACHANQLGHYLQCSQHTESHTKAKLPRQMVRAPHLCARLLVLLLLLGHLRLLPVGLPIARQSLVIQVNAGLRPPQKGAQVCRADAPVRAPASAAALAWPPSAAACWRI